MARLLLSPVRMKAWALLPLLASSGCLFLDGLNRPPTMTLDASITNAIKGGTLNMQYSITDDEAVDETLNPPLFAVEDATNRAPLDRPCDFADSWANGSYDIRFFRAGTFKITATTTDRQGAVSNSATVMVTIEDAPPIFSADAMVIPTSTRNACNLNTAGDVLTLAFKGSVDDADATVSAPDNSCAGHEKISYVWRISAQPSGTKPVLTIYNGSGCAQPTAASGLTVTAADAAMQVCLWTDPMIVGSTAMYSVVMDVSDGTTSVTSPVVDVPVGADEPPCITGTDPVAGSYVVDRTQEQEFAVDGVVDDRDLFCDVAGMHCISYAWSVWRESDPVWRDVPSYTLSTYSLDVSSFGVGENVRVRVEAIDRTGVRASAATCPVDADDCVVTSCASSPNVCHKWKTWDLELR